MKPYYIATGTGDDGGQWVFMFHIKAQAEKFVELATNCKLPEHPSYVGIHWDIIPITVQHPTEALSEYLGGL